jgi:hypothetical protein
MKTKKSAPAPKPEAPVSVEQEIQAPEEKVNRISIPLTADGQIDYSSMREKTRQKVKELIGEREATQTKEIVEVFDPAWVGSLYDSLGKLEQFAVTKMYKIHPEDAERAFTYSQAEKEKLAGPTAKVINKYAAVWMVQFKDEIALAFLLVTLTTVKFQMASMLSQQRAAMEKAAAAPRPTIVPDAKAAKEIADLEKMAGDSPAQA